MLRFAIRQTRVKELLELRPMAPPLAKIRQAAGLSRRQFAAVLKVHPNTLYKWEVSKPNSSVHHLAWLVFLAYLAPDRLNGWVRAAVGSSPTDRLDPEVVQKVVQPLGELTQVAGYQRRSG